MARLPYVDPAAAPQHVREVLAKLPAQLNIFRMAANSETTFRPFLGLGTAILASRTFDPKLREMVILQVGKISRGAYEWIQHVPIAQACGVSNEQILALEQGNLDAGCFDAQEKAILKFASDACRNVKASKETFNEAAKHLSPGQMVELLMIVGFYRTVAVLTESTDIEIDEPVGTSIVDAVR